MDLLAWFPGADGALAERLAGSAPQGVRLGLGEDGLSADEQAKVQVLIEGVPDAARLDALPALRQVVIPYAGVPGRTLEVMRARPHLTLYNLHHNAASTAELALTLYLAAAKQVVPLDQRLRQGDWRPRYEETAARTVRGKRAVVLGLGAIGTRLARALLALELEVIGIRREPAPRSEDPPGVRVLGIRALPEAIEDADALFVCLPRTPETDGLVDAGVLSRLAPGAVLVNIARGPVVDEDALHDALTSGHLGGAGLDVWWRYPRTEDDRADCPPSNQPFHELDQVVFSPHRGGLTREDPADRARALLDLLARLRADLPPRAVDLEAGY